MALKIIGTSTVGAGITADLGTSDSLFVGAGVVLGSTDGNAVQGTGSFHLVNVQGSVAGGDRAIVLGDDGTVDNNQHIIIGSAGYVTSTNSGYNTIFLRSYSNLVENDGTIFASYSGIYFGGSKNDTTSELFNNGKIESKNIAVWSGGGEALSITNDGTIKGKNAAIRSDGSAVDSILNDGKIIGNVNLGDGDDKFDTRDGTLTGTLNAGAGADTLNGSSKADTFNGDGGNDKMYGFNGDDILSGGTGNDYISGSTGKDKIAGDLGKDELRGGADADTFIFKALTDSTTTAVGRDLILDFSQSQKDKIDLALIDAKVSTGADNSFSFIGKNSFTQAEGQLRYKTENGVTKIYGDTNGDGTADFAIWLDGAHTLKATDFIL